MSDTKIIEPTQTEETSLPGELACVFAKGIAWLILFVGVVFGFKVVAPFLKSVADGTSSVASSNEGFGYIFISCSISAIVLFVLIAICENLIIMNKKQD